jgi:hypothetical protein
VEYDHFDYITKSVKETLMSIELVNQGPRFYWACDEDSEIILDLISTAVT